jgi:transcriptional regulator with XRE-family HTH domain
MAKQGYKNRIRVILADRNITNRALADKMGVSEMTVSRWVTNRFQPSMSQFVEISKILNVDIKILIEVDPNEISGSADDEAIYKLMYPSSDKKTV